MADTHATAPTHDGPPPCELDVLEMQLCRAKARIAGLEIERDGLQLIVDCRDDRARLRQMLHNQMMHSAKQCARIAELEAGLRDCLNELRVHKDSYTRGSASQRRMFAIDERAEALLEASNG